MDSCVIANTKINVREWHNIVEIIFNAARNFGRNITSSTEGKHKMTQTLGFKTKHPRNMINQF